MLVRGTKEIFSSVPLFSLGTAIDILRETLPIWKPSRLVFRLGGLGIGVGEQVMSPSTHAAPSFLWSLRP